MSNTADQNKDYFTPGVATFVFCVAFFGADYFQLPFWLKVPLGGIGAGLGYLAGLRLKRVALKSRLLIVGGVVAIVLAAALVGRRTASPLPISFPGKWTSVPTENEDDETLVFRMTSAGEFFLSKAPEYKEFQYAYVIKDDSLRVINKEGDPIFNMKIVVLDSNQFRAQQGAGTEFITFSRDKE